MSSKKNVVELAKTQVVLCDGAMGTMLQTYGLRSGKCPELWNVEQPNIVKSIHAAYVAAGSKIISTNTFGGNRLKLDSFGLGNRVRELNQAGVYIAREVAGNDCFVAVSIGPSGRFLEPLGDLTFDEAVAKFEEQAFAAAEAGADIILLETFSAIEEAKAALSAAIKTGLPCFCTMAFDTGGRTMMGVSPVTAAKELTDFGASGVGANCGLGPVETLEIIKQMRSATSNILIAQPNAGLPKVVNGHTIYDSTPEDMAQFAIQAKAIGVNIIGGCCGTTPEHIRAMAEKLSTN
jgi:5-methyltetrahydrofolate--homocysteine methyltransferase